MTYTIINELKICYLTTSLTIDHRRKMRNIEHEKVFLFVWAIDYKVIPYFRPVDVVERFLRLIPSL